MTIGAMKGTSFPLKETALKTTPSDEEVVEAEREKALLLNPRQYQSQLYEKAKEQNVIACLGTGSGKTLISVMLLKHMFEEEQAREGNGVKAKKRVSVFLVNKTPLVHQQAQVISTNSCLNVAELCGDMPMNLDLSKASSWDTLIRRNRYDVLVSTAQLILDGLIHAFVRIDEFILMVFDEAHHAAKDDCFSRIMRDHYRTTPEYSRPKIFGMTASPLKCDGDYLKACVELESTLDAKIFTASLGLRKEMETVSPSAETRIIQYSRAAKTQTGALTTLIRESCSHLEQIEKPLNRMKYHDDQHGSLVSDLAWIGSIEELKGRVQRMLEQAGLDPELNLLSPEWMEARGKERMTESSVEGQALFKRRRRYINDAVVNNAINLVVGKYGPMADTVTVDESNATPKILKTIEVLRTCGATPSLQRTFCCIMFVNRQKTAVALTELLKRIEDLKSWLKPEWYFGHNPDHGEGMDLKAQAATLKRFGKRGSTNLLIATSVAEEGLDISPCNCVIRFDLFEHHTGYLQSKGRARRKDSLFILLVEEANLQHYTTLRKVTLTEEEIAGWLQRLPESQAAIASMDSEDGEVDLIDLASEPTLTSPSTGACIRPIESVSIVCHYVALLRTDEFSRQKPEFFYSGDGDRGYQVEVRLPANAKIGHVRGPWCVSKKKACRTASFETCKRLYEAGELDEHLHPRKIKSPKTTEPPVSLAKRKRGEAGTVHEVQRRTAEVYQSGIPRAEGIIGAIKVHAVLVQTDAVLQNPAPRPVLVLFPSAVAALPAVELNMSPTRTVPATEDSVEIILEKDQARSASLYSYRIMCLLARQEWESARMPYLILPTREGTGRALDGSCIDWQEVNRSASPLSTPLAHSDKLSFAAGATLGPHDWLVHDKGEVLKVKMYEATSLRHDLDPFTTHPDGGDLSASLSSLASRLVGRTNVHSSRVPIPLLEVITILRPGCLLDRSDMDERQEEEQRKVLWPPFSSLIACSASFFRSCTLLPSILQRYDQVFLARELNEALLGNTLDETRLVEALTVPGANQAMSYERLEFLGDCYLKLLATSWAFSKCDSHREGDLHLERRDKISNASLFTIAQEKGVAEYALSQSFSIKTWSPPLLSSRQKTMTLADKTISDLVEGILGAGLVSCTDLDLSKANECATRLTILGKDVPCDLKTFQATLEGQMRPKEQRGKWSTRVKGIALDRLQTLLGYSFALPHLALEAVIHPSTIDADLCSYDRLEFLGDAVLDFLVVAFFKRKFPHLNESSWTLLKSNAVSNASLGVLCVQLGLNGFLHHDNTAIAAAITTFAAEMAEAKREAEEGAESGEVDMFWLEMKPPKALADIVESIIGAVFVDSGFSLSDSQQLFDRLYRSHFDTYFRPESAVVQSPKDFIKLIQSLRCSQWQLDMHVLEQEEEEREEGEAVCSLVFHNLVLARQWVKAEKVESLVQLNEELECHRLGAVTSEELDARFLKVILNACLPKNFIRDSQWNVAGEEVLIKFRNRCSSLQAQCSCTLA